MIATRRHRSPGRRRSRWSSSTAGGSPSPGPGNAISLAETPVFDALWSGYPHTQLSASGRDVGLPDGQMGNSEVGHLNLGAGAIVKQDLTRIDDAIADGSFFENEVLLAACERGALEPARAPAPDRPRLRRRRPLRLGAHRGAASSSPRSEGVPDLVVHAFTDGRDTLPHGGRRLPRGARALAAPAPAGSARSAAATTRWTATTAGSGPSSPTTRSSTREGLRAATAAEAIAAAYERGETDEFVKPTVIGDYDGDAPTATSSSSSTSAPTAPRADRPGARRPGLRRVRPRRRRRLDADDDDRVPRRLALPGRLPAAARRRRRWPR